MRTDLLYDWIGRLNRLNYKKLIVAAFLLRVIFAAAYDIYVSIADKDILVPDSFYYSGCGRYASLVLEGYDMRSIPIDRLPRNAQERDVLKNMTMTHNGRFPPSFSGVSILYTNTIGFIYFLLGHYKIWARIFNITLSILGTYLLFRVAKTRFGDLAANLFLLIGLFLPTQFIYSLTLSRDLIRMFMVSLIIWGIYGR